MVRSFVLRYYSALLAPIAAYLIWALLLHGLLPRPYFLLLAAVIISSSDAGLIAGLAASVLGAFLSLVSFSVTPSAWLNLGRSSVSDILLFVVVALLATLVQEALRRKYLEESYAASHLEDGVYVLHPKGRVVWANHVAGQLLGVDRRTLIGKKFHGTVCH